MSLSEHMLFESTSPQHLHQRSLSETDQSSLWAAYDEDAGDPHMITAGDEVTDSEAAWLWGTVFDEAEDPTVHGNTPAAGADASVACNRDHVICEIESIFESMVDNLLSGGDSLTLVLKSRAQTQPAGFVRDKVIRFPGRTAEEAWKFTVLTRILDIVHEALAADCVVTKREIYYRHPALFANQAVVDRYVDDIAFTFGVSRSSLNVSAAAKGLVTGALTIVKADGISVYKFDDPSGHLIPNMDAGDFIRTNAAQVLVVEKEAVFRSIATSKVWDALRHSTIMVTGKGYPDLSTRTFLHKLSITSTTGDSVIPILALVDMDPDGLSIMCTYKYGSIALAHEGVSARVPGIQWLGLKSVDILPVVELDPDVPGSASVRATEDLLSLSSRDRKKALQMLCKQAHSEHGFDHELRRNLQIMLMLNMKAELEILESTGGGLGAWLLDRLGFHDGMFVQG